MSEKDRNPYRERHVTGEKLPLIQKKVVQSALSKEEDDDSASDSDHSEEKQTLTQQTLTQMDKTQTHNESWSGSDSADTLSDDDFAVGKTPIGLAARSGTRDAKEVNPELDSKQAVSVNTLVPPKVTENPYREHQVNVVRRSSARHSSVRFKDSLEVDDRDAGKLHHSVPPPVSRQPPQQKSLSSSTHDVKGNTLPEIEVGSINITLNDESITQTSVTNAPNTTDKQDKYHSLPDERVRTTLTKDLTVVETADKPYCEPFGFSHGHDTTEDSLFTPTVSEESIDPRLSMQKPDSNKDYGEKNVGAYDIAGYYGMYELALMHKHRYQYQALDHSEGDELTLVDSDDEEKQGERRNSEEKDEGKKDTSWWKLIGSEILQRDWNEEFQSIIEQKCDSLKAQLIREAQIRVLSHEFAESAKQVARTIINEAPLVLHEKTIQPVSIGGVAGGEKYYSKGIFFKYSRDTQGLYAGHEFAMKASGHELKSLDALLGCNIPELHLPLMCLVDYKGYRIIATSLLPIDPNTLIYGSRNQGRTVVASEPHMNMLMEKAAAKLNLKKHEVGPKHARTALCMPADIEGHRGRDKRFYVVDTARLFPPERPMTTLMGVLISEDSSQPFVEVELAKLELSEATFYSHLSSLVGTKPRRMDTNELTFFSSGDAVLALNERASALAEAVIYGDAVVLKGMKGHVLYNLSRPELVASNQVPLSSDAFTGFGRHGVRIHNQEVQEATRRLIEVVIPNFSNQINSGEVVVASSHHLVDMMHEYGINIRYLGFVRFHIEKSRYRTLFLTEMVTRVAKNTMRARLRHAKNTDDSVCSQVAVKYFNLLFGSSLDSEYYWKNELKIQLDLKFSVRGCCFSKEEMGHDHDLRSQIMKLALFQALQNRTGIMFSEDTQRRFEQDPSLFEVEAPLSKDDLSEIAPKEKLMRRGKVIRQLLRELTPDASISATIPAEESIFSHLEYHNLVRLIYGNISPEVGASFIKLASTTARMDKNKMQPRAVWSTNKGLVWEVLPPDTDPQDLDVRGMFFGPDGKINAAAPAPNLPPGEYEFVKCLASENVNAGIQVQWVGRMDAYVSCSLEINSKVSDCPLELLVGSYYNIALVHEAAGRLWLAELHQRVALECLDTLYGDRYSGGGGGHPFQMILCNKIVDGMHKQGHTQIDQKDISSFADRFVALWSIYPFLGDSWQRAEMFGKDPPMALILLAEAGVLYLDGKTVKFDNLPPDHPRVLAWCKQVESFQDLNFKNLSDMTLSPKIASRRIQRESLPIARRQSVMLSRAPLVIDKNAETGTVTEIFSFGLNRRGQLGHNDTVDRSTPSRLPLLYLESERIIQLACGTEFTAALTAAGQVYTWGLGQHGRLGHGEEKDKWVPTLVRQLKRLKVVQIACGDQFTICLTDGGDVYNFGYGENGELGHGDLSTRFNPTLVETLSGKGICQIASGKSYSFALAANGSLYCWGRDPLRLTPVLTPGFGHAPAALVHGSPLNHTLRAKKVFCGFSNDAMIVTANGESWFWRSGAGRLPEYISSLSNHNTLIGAIGRECMAVNSEGDMFIWDQQRDPRPWIALKGQQISMLQCSMSHYICATDKGLYTWGRDGTYGQLGHGELSNEYTPRMVTYLNGKEIGCVAVGDFHTVVTVVRSHSRPPMQSPSSSFLDKTSLRQKRSIYGRQEWESLRQKHSMISEKGNGKEERIESPLRREQSNIREFSIEAKVVESQEDHSVTQLSSEMSTEQLKRGTVTDPDLSAVVHANPQKSLSSSSKFVITDQVYVFGKGDVGQLGTGGQDQKYRPSCIEIPLPSESCVVDVASRGGHTIFLTSAGDVLCCGENNYGQCGSGESSRPQTPVLVRALQGKRVAMISCGYYHSAAVTRTGEFYSWGNGQRGQLGYGLRNDQLTPRRVQALQGKIISSVSCGEEYTLALALDRKEKFGIVHSFGSNRDPKTKYKVTTGQLGLPADPRYLYTGPKFGPRFSSDEPISPVVEDMKPATDPRLSSMDPFRRLSEKGTEDTDSADGSTKDSIVRRFSDFETDIVTSRPMEGKRAPVSDKSPPNEPQSQNAEVEPPELVMVPAVVPALIGVSVVQVVAGSNHSFAVTHDGALYAWGSGKFGKLGLGKKDEQFTPVRVTSFQKTNIVAVSAGHDHALALTDTGEVYSFGAGQYGKLGHKNDKNDRAIAKRIVGLNGVHVVEIAAGHQHNAVLSSDGKVYTWGMGYLGQLGQGDRRSQMQPSVVEMPTKDPAVRICCGAYHTVVLTQTPRFEKLLQRPRFVCPICDNPSIGSKVSKSGFMEKRGQKTKRWKNRFFRLQGPFLVNSKGFVAEDSPEVSPEILAERGGEKFVRVSEIIEVSEANDEVWVPFSLKIVTPARKQYVRASSDEEAAAWLDSLRCAVHYYQYNPHKYPYERMVDDMRSEYSGMSTEMGSHTTEGEPSILRQSTSRFNIRKKSMPFAKPTHPLFSKAHSSRSSVDLASKMTKL